MPSGTTSASRRGRNTPAHKATAANGLKPDEPVRSAGRLPRQEDAEQGDERDQQEARET